MGPKQKKSTRKFEKKHLGTEIVRRKAAKVAAQRRRAKEMRLAASMEGDTAEDIGEEDAELYNAVSVLYLDGKANGQEMGDAWDAAIETVAMQSEMDQTELLERMNAAGKAHKEAISACKDAKAE